MRIKRLDLIKYGKFHDESLVFPAAPHDFHLLVGPNEAGKSTVRSAVAEWLFGMPQRTPLGFLHELSELRLGGVVEADGQETVFHRARGRTPLRTPADEKLPESFLQPLLGDTSKAFFENMFGLDHTRLIAGGESLLKASDEVGQVLFQSAAGVASLGPVREALEARAAQLWTKRSSSTEYAKAEARYHEALAALKSSTVRTRAWSEAKEALDQVNQAIDAANEKRLQFDTLRSRLERVRRVAPSLQMLKEKEAELTALGDVVTFPPTAYTDLQKTQIDLEVAQRVLEERGKDVQARKQEREAIVVDRAVLELADDIENLDVLRGACVNHRRDIPLREAEADGLLAAALDGAAQLGWPTQAQALTATLPDERALRRVTLLLQQYGGLLQAKQWAKEAVDEKNRELHTQQQQAQQLATTEVSVSLRLALDEAQGFRASAARLSSLRQKVSEAYVLLQSALAELGRWSMDVHALRTLSLPSSARVVDLGRERERLVRQISDANERVVQDKAELARLKLEATQFEQAGKLVTQSEVREARLKRDQAWQRVRHGELTLDDGGPLVDAGIRLADELVDAQLGSSAEAAALQAVRHAAELTEEALRHKLQAVSDYEKALQNHDLMWAALVNEVGVPGMPLADMPDWLGKRDVALTADAALRQRESELNAEQQAYARAAQALADALRAESVDLGDMGDTLDLPALVVTAAAHVQRMDAARSQQDSLAKQISQAESALHTLKLKAQQADAAFEAWQQQWLQAVQDARLQQAIGSQAEAEEAVGLASRVADKLSQAQVIRRTRIDTMLHDLQRLDETALHVANAVGEKVVTGVDGADLARVLMRRLRAAQEALKAAERIDGAIAVAQQQNRDAAAAIANAEARITPLLSLAGTRDVAQALPMAERSDRHRALQLAIAEAVAAVTRGSDGLSREAIEAEVAEYAPAEVESLLEQAKRDVAEVSEHLHTLYQQRVTAEQAFSLINGQSDAATAEARRQEALAEMEELAEQYLEAATAGRLLRWAIDRYRDQQQGPMLQRAGEVFSGLTLGQFVRLGVDYEVQPPALVARRKNEQRVEVAGLSEGTRDQLFLALRIAALELHLTHARALPFVADDLFINFDDARSRAGLEALRTLSQHTQVLFLTHHEHLLPLAYEVFGNALNVVRLERGAA